MPEVRPIVVPGESSGERVDRIVADVTGLSRSYVQKLIEAGALTQDGRPLRSNAVVSGGARLELVIPDATPLDLEPEAIPLAVVYEDDDILIVDKPAGLVVHPAPGHPGGTLVNALLARGTEYGGIAGVRRPGIVHRLDRDTSGLLMVAKHDAASTGPRRYGCAGGPVQAVLQQRKQARRALDGDLHDYRHHPKDLGADQHVGP